MAIEHIYNHIYLDLQVPTKIAFYRIMDLPSGKRLHNYGRSPFNG